MRSDTLPSKENAMEQELQDAYRALDAKDERIRKLEKELSDCWKVEEIIMAAGLLPKEKFNQAREIIASLG
jgi:hypothetical protein